MSGRSGRSTSVPYVTLRAVLVLTMAAPAAGRARAQEPGTAMPDSTRVAVPAAPDLRIKPVLVGVTFGAAAVVAAVNPSGPSPVSDEALVALGLFAGMVSGVVVQRPGAELALSAAWGGIRIGELEDQLAARGDRRRKMSPVANEVRISLLFRTAEQWAAGPVLGVVSHTFEQIERETRCSMFFGCFTGDFVTSYSHLQALNLGALARFTPAGRDGRLFTTIGAGLGSASLDSSIGGGTALAPYIEAGGGWGRPGKALRALEAGLRLQAADLGPASADLSGAFLRLRITHGPAPDA